MVEQSILAADEIQLALAGAKLALGDLIDDVSGVGVVRVPLEWTGSTHQLLIVGQETGGMENQLREMIDDPALVDYIASTYAGFDFAEGTKVRYSPFWRAHRALSEKLEAGEYRRVMWTNLVKVQSRRDHRTSILALGPDDTRRVVEWQAPIVRRELAELAPGAVVFFTGPNYDDLLRIVFPDVRLEACLDGVPVRTLARVQSALLPRNTFRTYHPGFLNRNSQFSLIDQIAELIGD